MKWWGKKPEHRKLKRWEVEKFTKWVSTPLLKSLAVAMLSMSSDTAYFIMTLKFSKPKNNLRQKITNDLIKTR